MLEWRGYAKCFKEEDQLTCFKVFLSSFNICVPPDRAESSASV